MLPKLINKIYIINLKSCVDRKEHIKQEFKRVGINEYEIFEATDKDSIEVRNMIKSDFVKKFPPCFRCGRNECNCPNNILISSQIGNWCSFINVMNDIIKNDLKDLIMICEDDIKFSEDSMYIFNNMITNNNLKKYNIDYEKPILIRSEQRGEFPSLNNLRLTKEVTMSNACFIVNKSYAESFINNLKVIDTTSDIYLQKKILQYDKNIQHFTIEPSPVYQLSDNKNAMFKSEIHPKGIDKEDKIRMKDHFKKVEYNDYLDNISYINNRNLWHSSCNNNKNVGDLVGKYIYEKITGNKINYIHPSDTKDKVLLTCGSIIQDKHVKYNNTIIWGSGIMFENISKFNSKIFAVRGKKTAEILDKLDIKCPQIFGDVALLLPRFYNPKNLEKHYDIGLIFHYSHFDKDIINFLKQRYKLNIISVDLEIENFVTEVLKCKYTISSSLHGVIISHSYSVQSLPFNLEEKGLNGTFFKFEDYYSSFDLEFKPYFKKDILNNKNIIQLIKNYNQPKFPINTDKLYNSCPFLKLPNTV